MKGPRIKIEAVCDSCDGTGHHDESRGNIDYCPDCGGTGYVEIKVPLKTLKELLEEA